jgi:hypothetical protein
VSSSRGFTALSALALLSGFGACALDERSLSPVSVQVGSGGTAGKGGHAGTVSSGTGGGGAGSGGSGGTAGGPPGSGGSLDPVGGTSSGGSGGSSAGRGGSEGKGGTGGKGGGAGTEPEDGGDGGGTVERCFDLDDNDVLDCDETLADNATFDDDAEGWAAENNADARWDASDAGNRSDSGSILVENLTTADAEGEGLTAASQCVAVTGGNTYDVIGMARVLNEETAGKGVLNLWYFSDADCTGNVRAGFSSGPASSAERWTQVRVISSAPSNAVSMLVRLGVQKPFREPSAKVRFDDLLVKGL